MKNPLFKYSNLPGCNYLIFLILLLCFSLPILAKGQSDTTSFLQTVDIKTGKIDTLLIMKNVFEAPNWHPDNFLVINSGGELYKFELDTKKLTVINTDFANLCNNDHGISADGKWLAISHNDTKDPSTKPYKSAIYKVPITGGKPIKITTEVPSFWHGWNPTGKDIVYCAERNGNYDIYRIGVNGGTEK